jgi:hypothetical protein
MSDLNNNPADNPGTDEKTANDTDLVTTPDQAVQSASASPLESVPVPEPAVTRPLTQPPIHVVPNPQDQGSPIILSAPNTEHRGPQITLGTPNTPILSDDEVERQMRRISRRSFLSGAVGVAAGVLGWRWLISQYPDNGIPWPFRRALEIDEGFARTYFKGSRLAPTFPRARATEPRANGDAGLPDDFDPDAWKLHVTGLDGDDATLTLAAIKALPRVEMVTELKCIEGWSVIVQWAGVRFADFMAKYPPPRDDDHHLPQYVALETPDGGYYVGLDMASAMHPQTLLCYEMNGEPLTAEHGAPLRLAIPVKYGIKNIKRIGLIRYTNERPKDYWAERGYDWYAGH